MATSPITPQRKRFSLWLGLAMLVTLLLGAIVGLYLTRTNQDIRQQAAGSCSGGNKQCVPAGTNCAALGGKLEGGDCSGNTICCSIPPGATIPTPTKKPENPNPPPTEECVAKGNTCIEGLSKDTGWCVALGRANVEGSCNKGVCCSGGTSSGGTGGSGGGSVISINPGDYCDNNGCDGKGQCLVIRYHCDRNSGLSGGCQDSANASSTGRINFSASCGSEQIDVCCRADGKCTSNDPQSFHVSKSYSSACKAPTPTPKPPVPTKTTTPTPTPKPPGPQCLKLEMSGFPSDANTVVPGTTQVTFTCAANATLPSGHSYKFRVFEPCGSANHATPKELTASGATATYTIPLRGSYAAQCAVCNGTGASASCDWEPYTPSSC